MHASMAKWRRKFPQVSNLQVITWDSAWPWLFSFIFCRLECVLSQLRHRSVSRYEARGDWCFGYHNSLRWERSLLMFSDVAGSTKNFTSFSEQAEVDSALSL